MEEKKTPEQELMEKNINPNVKSIKMITTTESVVMCYFNCGLPLHQDCPYGKKEIDTNCQLCIRHNKKSKTIDTKIIKGE